jgi:predicted ferric reductase
MAKPSPLDDPRVSAHAWRHYKRLMIAMVGVTIAVVIVALTAIYLTVGMVSVHVFLASALGIILTMLLMSALMGLVFLSSGTGHDEAISDIEDDGTGPWNQDSGGRNR